MPHLYLRGQSLSPSCMLIQPYRAKKNADYRRNSKPSQEGREQKCKARPASMFSIIPYVGFHSSILKMQFHPGKQVACWVSDPQRNHPPRCSEMPWGLSGVGSARQCQTAEITQWLDHVSACWGENAKIFEEVVGQGSSSEQREQLQVAPEANTAAGCLCARASVQDGQVCRVRVVYSFCVANCWDFSYTVPTTTEVAESKFRKGVFSSPETQSLPYCKCNW